ncbi:MAG: hypothetical protein ACKV22_34675 [Bryobacteraceae bacterium]
MDKNNALVPPYPGDAHIDLGVWHKCACPSEKQNAEGYNLLLKEHSDTWCCGVADHYDDTHAIDAVQRFTDDLIALADALPDEEVSSRPWSIVLCLSPLYLLISLWPSVALEIMPRIAELAKKHGLVYYDAQSKRVILPD